MVKIMNPSIESESVYNRSSLTFSIPRSLMALDIFTLTERMILTRIISLSSKYLNKGGCTLSNHALAEAHDCSSSTVSNVISKASWLGFITKREDKIDNFVNAEGSVTTTQSRRIVMVIPDFIVGVGEIWSEGYFAGHKPEGKAARTIIKKINEHLKVKLKEKDKEKGEGLKEIKLALMGQILSKENLKNWMDFDSKKAGSESSNTPLLNFQVPPPFENSALYMFTGVNVSGDENLKDIGETASQSSPPDIENKNIDLEVSKKQIIQKKAERILTHFNKLRNEFRQKHNLKKSSGFGPTQENLKPIIAILNKKKTYKECIQVLENKIQDEEFVFKDWYNPETLFRAIKFQKYLDYDPTQYKKQSSTNKPSNGSGYTGTRKYKEAKVVKNVFTPWED